jgi:hypothetical protein
VGQQLALHDVSDCDEHLLAALVRRPMALEGPITVGALFAMISYVLMLNAPSSGWASWSIWPPRPGPAPRRVFEIIDRRASARAAGRTSPLTRYPRGE